ncbi:MAG: hypothetical protein IKT99_07545 [Oscillospiraceae bacterium]|nr:hypothetical protein [Oscillospiraceae bacterium]
MKELLICAILLGVFAFGYFAVDRLGRFLEGAALAVPAQEQPGRRVYVLETGDARDQSPEAVDAALETLRSCGEYEIIFCTTADQGVQEYLEHAGFSVGQDARAW